MKNKEFICYLKRKYHYSERTLQEKVNQITKWKKLCIQSQKLEDLRTKEVLSLVELLRQKYNIQTLNNYIKTLEQYYAYLIEVGKMEENPVRSFRIKTDKKTLIQGLLTEQELRSIYENYSVQGHYGGQFDYYKQRNKVILGMMVYQGLDSGTLGILEVQSIDLEKGILKVPKSSEYKLNERVLTLESEQILEIYRYLTQTRQELLKLLKVEENTKKLFPKSEKTRISSITKSIKKELSKNYKLSSLIQLRYSRISIWKKRYNLRETQYRSGYKSLLSLEKFNQEEIEELQQSIEKYHPMK